eukprot:scaffold28145_cov98-Isochrysis_galbana.AAC.3
MPSAHTAPAPPPLGPLHQVCERVWLGVAHVLLACRRAEPRWPLRRDPSRLRPAPLVDEHVCAGGADGALVGGRDVRVVELVPGVCLRVPGKGGVVSGRGAAKVVGDCAEIVHGRSGRRRQAVAGQVELPRGEVDDQHGRQRPDLQLLPTLPVGLAAGAVPGIVGVEHLLTREQVQAVVQRHAAGVSLALAARLRGGRGRLVVQPLPAVPAATTKRRRAPDQHKVERPAGRRRAHGGRVVVLHPLAQPVARGRWHVVGAVGPSKLPRPIRPVDAAPVAAAAVAVGRVGTGRPGHVHAGAAVVHLAVGAEERAPGEAGRVGDVSGRVAPADRGVHAGKRHAGRIRTGHVHAGLRDGRVHNGRVHDHHVARRVHTGHVHAGRAASPDDAVAQASAPAASVPAVSIPSPPIPHAAIPDASISEAPIPGPPIADPPTPHAPISDVCVAPARAPAAAAPPAPRGGVGNPFPSPAAHERAGAGGESAPPAPPSAAAATLGGGNASPTGSPTTPGHMGDGTVPLVAPNAGTACRHRCRRTSV